MSNQSELFEAVLEGRAPVKTKVVETDSGYSASVDQWGVKVEAEGLTSSGAQNKAVGKFLDEVKNGRYKISRF